MIVTPLVVLTTFPGIVNSQLPGHGDLGSDSSYIAAHFAPAAMSTITDPGFILETMALLTSFGGGRPGRAAVRTITSILADSLAYISSCIFCTSGPNDGAYPPLSLAFFRPSGS